MTTTNDQLARQIENLAHVVSEQGKQHAVLAERVDTNARLAAEERQSVRQKIAEVQRGVVKTQETAEATKDTLTSFVDKIEGGRLVVKWGWIGLTGIGGLATAVWAAWPKIAALFVK